jgi:ParB family transcriptional regulator, chromosome partitioning protein
MKLARRLLPDLAQLDLFGGKPTATGEPLMVPVSLIDEDPGNPRTAFPEAQIDELAQDIGQHGLLQPIVVHTVNAAGRYRIRFGALRLRAAVRAGLTEVPVTIRNRELDAYAQVAENQKRQGLSVLDLARFIRSRADAGESNAQIAKRLGLDATPIAHHLTLLDLPPVLETALPSGRCESPRTLYELSKLHAECPERVTALVQGDCDITRQTVASLRTEEPSAAAPSVSTTPAKPVTQQPDSLQPLVAQAEALCARLSRLLDRIRQQDPHGTADGSEQLRQHVADLLKH